MLPIVEDEVLLPRLERLVKVSAWPCKIQDALSPQYIAGGVYFGTASVIVTTDYKTVHSYIQYGT